jgi:hypothetical protein
MTDTELKTAETDVTKALAGVKATLASDELKASTEVKSLWQRYELYLIAGIALIVGLIAGHLLK